MSSVDESSLVANSNTANALAILAEIVMEMECPVCMNLVVEPVTTVCGHTFCKMCLVQSVKFHQRNCPSCRAVFLITAEDATVNSMVKSIARSINPKLYAERLIVHEESKKSWLTFLPVFVHPYAVYPNEKILLDFYEARYSLMMRRIGQTTRTFACVLTPRREIRKGDLALKATVKDSTYRNGRSPYSRYSLEVLLLGRYTILEQYCEPGTEGLYYCRLEELHDHPIPAEELREVERLVHISESLCRAIIVEEVKERTEDRYGIAPTDPEGFSLWLTAVVVNENSVQLELLQSRSTLHRLRSVMDHVDRFYERVKANRHNKVHRVVRGVGFFGLVCVIAYGVSVYFEYM